MVRPHHPNGRMRKAGSSFLSDVEDFNRTPGWFGWFTERFRTHKFPLRDAAGKTLVSLDDQQVATLSRVQRTMDDNQLNRIRNRDPLRKATHMFFETRTSLQEES